MREQRLTVAQLIEKLQALPPEAQATVPFMTVMQGGYCCCYRETYENYYITGVVAGWRETYANNSRYYQVEFDYDY